MRRFLPFLMGVVLAVSAGAYVLGAGASADAPKPGEVITGSELGFRVDQVVGGRVAGKSAGDSGDPVGPGLPAD